MWLVFALLTTFLWGLAELFYKMGAREEEKYAHLKICISVGAVMGIHALFTLLTGNIGYDPINLLRYLPVSLLYIVSMALSFFGMRFIEESILDPIENTSGAVCALLCVLFLGYEISLPAALSIGVIAIGVAGIGYLENRDDGGRKKRLGVRLAFVAFLMPFLYALLDAFGSFLDVFYLEDVATTPLVNVTEETIEAVANTSYELTFAFVALVLYVYIRIRGEKFGFLNQKTKMVAAVCETGGQFTYVYAMARNGALAAPVISSVCVVALVLSRVFLKEKLTKKHYIFIGLAVVGVIVLGILEGE